MSYNINVIFIYTAEIIPEFGGVQRVTKVLSDYFKSHGINVSYLSLERESEPSKELINHYFFPNCNLYSIENTIFFKEFVLKKKIDIIINQAGLGGYMASLCDKARSVRNVKIISVIHNSLLGNVQGLTMSNKKIFNKIPLSTFSLILETFLFRKLLLELYKFKYKRKYINLYNLSDKVVLLSDSYFKELKLFVKKADKNKVISISNPCTVNKLLDTNITQKKNELLYVGRINTSQKRVDLLLEIWQKIYPSFPNWKLNIVGDGKELSSLKDLSKKKNLKRVKFLGHKDPIPYYKTAKILCMTSSFEGFPLVLVEAHSFNVIPILFNSFPSTIDVIKDGENGILVKPLCIETYATKLIELMSNYDQLKSSFHKECSISTEKFSLTEIGNKWLDLFKELTNIESQNDI